VFEFLKWYPLFLLAVFSVDLVFISHFLVLVLQLSLLDFLSIQHFESLLQPYLLLPLTAANGFVPLSGVDCFEASGRSSGLHLGEELLEWLALDLHHHFVALHALQDVLSLLRPVVDADFVEVEHLVVRFHFFDSGVVLDGAVVLHAEPCLPA